MCCMTLSLQYNCHCNKITVISKKLLFKKNVENTQIKTVILQIRQIVKNKNICCFE